MVNIAEVSELDSGVKSTCNRFFDQAGLVLPLSALAIVLLDPDEGTGRVVFSWRASPSAEIPSNEALASLSDFGVGQKSILDIALHGEDGPLGMAMLRSLSPDGFSPPERQLARDLSRQLAIRLENTTLHHRVQVTVLKAQIMDELAHIIASTPNFDEIFNPLAAARGLKISSKLGVLAMIWASSSMI